MKFETRCYQIQVSVRPTADNGVTVNGIGLWPEEPKDERGYTVKIDGDLIVYYNFDTGHAEIKCYHLKEYPQNCVVYMVASAVFMGIVVSAILYCLFFN